MGALTGSVVVELEEGAPLRVLSLWQPWASLVAARAKRYETRAWRPREIGRCRPRDYLGLVAIHAARTTFHPPLSDPLEEIMETVGLAPVDELPRGSIVALVRVLRVVPTAELRSSVGWREVTVGDWSEGRFAWDLDLLGVPEAPIPFRAAQGCRQAPMSLTGALVRSLLPPPITPSFEGEKQDKP